MGQYIKWPENVSRFSYGIQCNIKLYKIHPVLALINNPLQTRPWDNKQILLPV